MIYLLNKLFFFLRDYLSHISNKDNYKKCFSCNYVKKVGCFGINDSKYQRPEEKGRNYKCNKCIKDEKQRVL